MTADESGRATHRPPRDDLAGMSPTANYDGLERRVCPNCRMYFDVGENSEQTFCSESCRHRHEGGVLLADGGRGPTQEFVAKCLECGAKTTLRTRVGESREEGEETRQQCFSCGLYGPSRTFEVTDIVG